VRRAAAAVALVGTLCLSACGQSAEERFRTHDLRPVQQALEKRQSELAAVLQGARPGRRRDARAVREAVDAVAAAAKRVVALQAPVSVAPTFARYTAATERLVRTLESFAAAMRRTDQSRLTRASERARAATGSVHRARDALEAALTT
jgi:hypothetical protein